MHISSWFTRLILVGGLCAASHTSLAGPLAAGGAGETDSEHTLDWRAISARRHISVANNGVDTSHCGGEATPCRSINQAFSIAQNGDTILVGPGLYGDLNDDGDFDDPGEEHGSNICLICINNKAISIYSTDGAEATTIFTSDNPSSGPDLAVDIRGDGVRLGAVGHGFTISGQINVGIQVTGATHTYVVGNIVRMRGLGIWLQACDGPIVASDNVASGSRDGFWFSKAVGVDGRSCNDAGRAVVRRNVATDNYGIGFQFFSQPGLVFEQNVSTRNGTGAVTFFSDVRMRDNVIVANHGAGIVNSQNGQTILHNVIVGNSGPGVIVNGSEETPTEIRENNIFGNDADGSNCGITNASNTHVDAKFNYWGKSSGPGANPADNAGPGSTCDQAGTTQVKPFAPGPFHNSEH